MKTLITQFWYSNIRVNGSVDSSGFHLELIMTSSSSLNTLFKYRRFDREIIILCVRWYVSYKFRYLDLVKMMAKPGIELAHTTVLR